MFVIVQGFVYLALALIIGGAIGYAFRTCLADTACDDVRADLSLSQARYEALLGQSHQVGQTVVASPPNDGSNLSKLTSRELERAILSAGNGRSPARRLGADDLTAIKGITPRLDVWLAQQNITRFEHLVNLDPGELYWLVENAPENGSSIYRDQWIAQARAQMR